MKIRFQADADLNEDIVAGVLRRAPEIDFQTATEAGLQGLKDENVLASAASENRILVTSDRKIMPRHFAEFVRENVCPRILIVPQKLDVGVAIDELILIWLASEAKEYVNSIRQLPL